MGKRPIEKTLGGFEFKDIQVFRTIVQTLSSDGYTIEEALTFIDANKVVVERAKEAVEGSANFSKPCPECGIPLRLGSVGENDKGYQHQWYCPNDGCTFIDELGLETVPEVLKSMGAIVE